MSAELVNLSRAELAVVFQHLWGQGLASSDTMLADLDLGADELAAGRQSLIERGLLLAAPRRSDTALSPSLEPVLQAVTRPQVLGVLQIGGAGSATRSAHFSWRPGTLVFNRVTEAGDHVLELMPDSEQVGKAVVEYSALSAFTQAAEEDPSDPETIVREASVRAVFMAVADPAAVQPATEAVSWLVSRDRLWLVTPAEADQSPVIRQAIAAEVGAEAKRLLEHAIERVRSRANGSGPSTTTRGARKDRKPPRRG